MKGGSNRLISAAEAAEVLGVSRDWLYKNWRAIGLKAKNVAAPGARRKTLRFAERDIDAWIDRNSA